MTNNLADVRRAAERLAAFDAECKATPATARYAHRYCVWDDASTLRSYILSTIPTDPEGEVTPEWLREEWGAEEEYADDVVFWWMPIGHDDGVLNVERDSGRVYIHDAGSDRIVAELRHITTRHQFTQLMQSLGIQPRGKGER